MLFILPPKHTSHHFLSKSINIKTRQHRKSIVLHSKLLNKYVRVENGCHTQAEADRCGYGRLRVTFRDTLSRLKTHRVMFAMVHHNITLSSSMDVSPLCHSKGFVDPEYLSYEPYSID